MSELGTYSKLKPISTDWLSRFATQQNQDAVAALNASIGTHNDNVDMFEASYADAIAGNVAPADATTTAVTLASTRLSLAAEAIVLAGQKSAIRVAIRADFAGADATVKQGATGGIPALNEAVNDPNELQQVTCGLGAAMQQAIG